ncbi:cystathionine gamma-synthase [Nocardia sp. MH4]|uniref:cystathionine gamma-synthase n=1 Tax=Nocardia TaxID=1817 RepID=UPI001C4FFFE1|nr:MULTISPECIES: cystathionine gamma-synthase [Nocardia]MBW0273253.1 cystathionine gamma-synthase [Nocardia sp. MH4]
MSELGFSTRAIHAGYEPDPQTGAVNVPIYASSTFAQDGVGGMRGGYEYARTGNPTRTALEGNLAALESGSFARAFASGMAATDCALRATLRPGDHIVIPDDAYGGTFRLIDKVFSQWGIEHSPAHIADLDQVRAAIRPNTKLVWIETPTNPLLSIGDIPALADIAHEADAKLVVDNTFATPYLQQPLLLGADIVVHSTTKYLGGHSDVVGGALITNSEELDTAFAFLQNGAGAVPGPFDAFLTLRGIKTLAVRMEKHCDNAEVIAEFLTNHPAISQVIYPGLPTHPGYQIAQKQMRRSGGMISVRLAGGREAALKFCSRTEIFTLAESLGGIESLIEHPGAMTHASTEGSALEVPADLVRLSVGIEDISDLLADVEQALS